MYIRNRKEFWKMPDDQRIAGVVLIGGKSSRMGRPKALLPTDGEPMFLSLAKKLSEHFNQVYLSHRIDLFHLPENPYPVIADLYEAVTPMTGILSALQTLERPLFVLPTDMPEIGDFWIKQLMTLRNPNEICTVFYHESSGYYEPLAGIWEIHAIQVLQECLQQHNFSFQKLLEKKNVTKHFLNHGAETININTPEEYQNWNSKHLK